MSREGNGRCLTIVLNISRHGYAYADHGKDGICLGYLTSWLWQTSFRALVCARRRSTETLEYTLSE